MKVCLDCPTITSRTRCPACERKRDQARGSRQDRGYGADHDALRKEWAPTVATGRVRCARCREPIAPDAPWDLGHDDQDRTRYTGPEHEHCNRATMGRSNTPG